MRNIKNSKRDSQREKKQIDQQKRKGRKNKNIRIESALAEYLQ